MLQPQERPASVWQEIRQCFTENLLFNEERGKEAAGIGVLKRNGNVNIYKAPLPARQLVEQPAYRQIIGSLDAQTTLILGHTRHPTKGPPQNKNNNHPLRAGMLLGVHNGHINNDDDLFARRHYPRQGQVDSEIIFRLLWHDLSQPFAHIPLTTIRNSLQQLQGEFTILVGDQRSPESLLIVRHNKPLSLHYHPHWKALIFSSRYIFLRKTFGPIVLYETLPDNHLFFYNALYLSQYGAVPIQSQPCWPKTGKTTNHRSLIDKNRVKVKKL